MSRLEHEPHYVIDELCRHYVMMASKMSKFISLILTHTMGIWDDKINRSWQIILFKSFFSFRFLLIYWLYFVLAGLCAFFFISLSSRIVCYFVCCLASYRKPFHGICAHAAAHKVMRSSGVWHSIFSLLFKFIDYIILCYFFFSLFFLSLGCSMGVL